MTILPHPIGSPLVVVSLRWPSPLALPLAVIPLRWPSHFSVLHLLHWPSRCRTPLRRPSYFSVLPLFRWPFPLAVVPLRLTFSPLALSVGRLTPPSYRLSVGPFRWLSYLSVLPFPHWPSPLAILLLYLTAFLSALSVCRLIRLTAFPLTLSVGHLTSLSYPSPLVLSVGHCTSPLAVALLRLIFFPLALSCWLSYLTVLLAFPSALSIGHLTSPSYPFSMALSVDHCISLLAVALLRLTFSPLALSCWPLFLPLLRWPSPLAVVHLRLTFSLLALSCWLSYFSVLPLLCWPSLLAVIPLLCWPSYFYRPSLLAVSLLCPTSSPLAPLCWASCLSVVPLLHSLSIGRPTSPSCFFLVGYPTSSYLFSIGPFLIPHSSIIPLPC